MKAFLIDAGEHKYVEFSEDGWSLYETGWFGAIVYAETAAKAKHLFIKDNNADWHNPVFEYTDKMSIRLLATSTDEEWTVGIARFDDPTEEGGSPWMNGKRSKFGEEKYQEFKGWQKQFAEVS